MTSYAIQTNSDLKYQCEGVLGDCRNLFAFILAQIKKRLNHITLIISKKFEYRVKKDKFMKEKKEKDNPVMSVKFQ